MQLIDFGASFMVKSATYLEVNINPEDRDWFKELVQRGTNLWPDAPPAAKEFADLITSGIVLQDYSTQST